MASRTFLLVALLFFFFSFIAQVEVTSDDKTENPSIRFDEGLSDRRLLLGLNCGGKCKVRCGLHSRPNVCLRACQTCCYRCKCVPPGTSGNREVCGRCYTDMRTHGNRTKCP